MKQSSGVCVVRCVVFECRMFRGSVCLGQPCWLSLLGLNQGVGRLNPLGPFSVKGQHTTYYYVGLMATYVQLPS